MAHVTKLSPHVESERSVHDALCVLSQTVKTRRTVLGGGASEVFMATRVEALARQTAGKQALAIEAFARALRCIPTILADNGGYDSSELVSNLRYLFIKLSSPNSFIIIELTSIVSKTN